MRFSFSIFLLLAVTGVHRADERPNMIFILADDMGYGDIEALNPDSKIPTPHLNRLVEEGMTFTDGHSPSAVFTPTRYAFLTGRYSWRGRMKRGVLNGYGTPLLEEGRSTVASHLQQQGYQTSVIGKWHLGLGFQKDDGGNWDWTEPLNSTPLDYGFDRSLIIPASLDFPPYVFIEGRSITGLPDRMQPEQNFPGFLRQGELGSDFSILDCLDELTASVVEQIRNYSDGEGPFFLYFPLTAPHKPVSPHPRFQGRSGLGPYGDFIMQVDWTVGQVLEVLDQEELAENTLVAYTSDNGSFMYRLKDEKEPDHLVDESVQAYCEGNHTANGPLRGTKADIYEAGHRVPFIVRWPRGIAAGTQCDEPICHTDFFATAAELAKSKLPPANEAAEDSFSLVPLFDGEPGKFKRAPVVHHSGNGTLAIRAGDWKLILSEGSGGREKPAGKRYGTPWQLYHLAEDLGETNNRILSEQARAEEMASALMEIIFEEKSRK
ncbi:MAG: arylsulfatase [Verrucomicrobiota bacterium]